mmetsp:Transcript_28697/g.56198  ORF Transcript_28697/g.56198 Transcript_28697/m.56198 type:complete len:134 (-) Transcript_28697:299-700(-)
MSENDPIPTKHKTTKDEGRILTHLEKPKSSAPMCTNSRENTKNHTKRATFKRRAYLCFKIPSRLYLTPTHFNLPSSRNIIQQRCTPLEEHTRLPRLRQRPGLTRGRPLVRLLTCHNTVCHGPSPLRLSSSFSF